MSDATGADAATSSSPNGLTRLKNRATATWASLQERYTWLRHVLRAWELLNRNNGNQYAGAITYFSFVALFPLLLLAVSVLGFVLSSNPALLQDLLDKITEQVPGSLGSTLRTSVDTAIDNRAGVGIIGVAGLLLTGLGWIANLRLAVDAVWGRRPAKRNFLVSRGANLLVLAGLGLGIVASLALTAVGTSLTDQILKALSLDSVPGATVVLKIIGIAIAALGDMLIFWWVLIKLPQADVERRTAVRGLVMASVGYEILKIVGTYTIAHGATSPTAGPFVGLIAVLVWIQLVMRWMLFCCAWIATVNAARRSANTVPIVEPPAMVDPDAGRGASAVTPAAVGATLVGAGAVAGAVATWAATRQRAG